MAQPAIQRTTAVPTAPERAGRGRRARAITSFAMLAVHHCGSGRDPIGLLGRQAQTRLPDLVPLHYSRMSDGAFAFSRGSALLMADDLYRAPNSGLRVQLCGDAHLSNFGFFGSPEQVPVFGIDEYDETHPGPFEWDVKRLVTSLAIAADETGCTAAQRDRITRACAAEYRETMAAAAERGTLAVWYAGVESGVAPPANDGAPRAADELTDMLDGAHRIISVPPTVVPIEELFADADECYRNLIGRLSAFRATLRWETRVLVDQFELIQAARTAIGVRSVGARVWLLYLRGVVDRDPLLLQAKEAQPSVLAGYLGGPSFANQGERVVEGQRLMQHTPDPFLGWASGWDLDGARRDFYLRRHVDRTGPAEVESLSATGLTGYGRACARVLAQAHARSGDRIAIASYLGSTDEFDDAMVSFATSYSEQNQLDHAALLAAIADDRITAPLGT
jgi:uncharacterized protein (DUF2252 family)